MSTARRKEERPERVLGGPAIGDRAMTAAGAPGAARQDMVGKALQLLELLGEHPDGLTAAEATKIWRAAPAGSGAVTGGPWRRGGRF